MTLNISSSVSTGTVGPLIAGSRMRFTARFVYMGRPTSPGLVVATVSVDGGDPREIEDVHSDKLGVFWIEHIIEVGHLVVTFDSTLARSVTEYDVIPAVARMEQPVAPPPQVTEYSPPAPAEPELVVPVEVVSPSSPPDVYPAAVSPLPPPPPPEVADFVDRVLAGESPTPLPPQPARTDAAPPRKITKLEVPLDKRVTAVLGGGRRRRRP